MAIGTTGSAGTEIPAGTQVRWEVTDATFDKDGRYGPTIELDVDVVTPEFAGASTKYWCKIARPRLDKVTRLRGDGLDDETIETALRKQGFEFEDLDEADTMLVARSGALYAILTAGQGSVQGAEKALQECAGFEELAARLVGTRFVGTTKLSKDGYVRLDAKEDIFQDMEASNSEEGFDEISW